MPGQRTRNLAVLASILTIAGPSAHGQGDDRSGLDAAALAEELIDGLPCEATEASAALEAKLDERPESLTDLAAALEVIAASPEPCNDVRAAATRERQFISATLALGPPQTAESAPATAVYQFAFEAGPPPLNMLRTRRGGR